MEHAELLRTEEIFSKLKTSESGLTPEEAQARLSRNGPNRLAGAKKKTLWQRFREQLKSPMTAILAAAALVSGIMGETTDMTIILVVILLNAVLGLVQESKSEKAVEALQAMTASRTKVRRGGEVRMVDSAGLVPGDVVLLEAGDSVPADLRLLQSADFKTDESSLTGESVPVEKSADVLPRPQSGAIPLGDRKNMAYMGCSAVAGRGEGIVTATGMRTELGRIAGALDTIREEPTPLQQTLASLSKKLSLGVLGICLFLFVFSLIRAGSLSAKTILDTFMMAVSLAVAAVPEGLAAVVTIVLSIGVANMSRKNAIVRRLNAVETLGCTQVVCTDKTGTLTRNRMAVTEFSGPAPFLAKAFALCSDARVSPATGEIVGEPTENALVAFAVDQGTDQAALLKEYPRVGEAPFDSVRKRMSTVHADPAGGYLQFTKGAPEEILAACTHILKDGSVLPLTDELRTEIAEYNHAMAQKALRVLAAAFLTRKEKPQDFKPDTLETGLTFLGLAGMKDPVRPEALEAVRECRKAGIRPVMITGDHRDTAAAIAKELGIIQSDGEAITGSALDLLSDEELFASIEQYGVYARVQPEHKVRIVNAWKKAGMVTAMTGDGVNDAPALKNADIGVSMGITGTDVTKNAADMILADDNFATIISAVREGRRIYDNICKAIQFLLSSNLSEVLAVFTAASLGFALFRPVHILWINLITDSLPAVALGLETSEKGIMERRPRGRGEGLFSGGLGIDAVFHGCFVAALTLASFFIGKSADQSTAMTMAFVTMSMCEIFHAFNMRSRRGSIFRLHTHNRYLTGTALLALALTGAMVYLPVLDAAFSLQPLSLPRLLTALGLAVFIIPAVELLKAADRRFLKH